MTVEEISVGARCMICLPDKVSALLYLLATIAGVTVEEIAANSACFNCLADKQSAILYLLDQIAAGGGSSGNGCVLSTAGDPEGVLTAPCSPALAIDPNTLAIYAYTGIAGGNTGWTLKV